MTDLSIDDLYDQTEIWELNMERKLKRKSRNLFRRRLYEAVLQFSGSYFVFCCRCEVGTLVLVVIMRLIKFKYHPIVSFRELCFFVLDFASLIAHRSLRRVLGCNYRFISILLTQISNAETIRSSATKIGVIFSSILMDCVCRGVSFDFYQIYRVRIMCFCGMRRANRRRSGDFFGALFLPLWIFRESGGLIRKQVYVGTIRPKMKVGLEINCFIVKSKLYSKKRLVTREFKF